MIERTPEDVARFDADMRRIAARPAHQQFIAHMDLARLWARYNAQTGTETQCLRIMRQLTEDDLMRMLTERNVVLPGGQP